MADSSDSGSSHSFQVENIGIEEKKVETLNRFYALYSFNTRSTTSKDESLLPDGDSQSQDEGSCLSVLATNMTASTETDLRRFVTLRLSTSKTRIPDEGTCCSIGLSSETSTPSAASCYFSTFDLGLDPLGFDHVASDGKSFSDERQMFVVCFVSFQENSLDLFQSELDNYCQGLRPLLDKEHAIPTLPTSDNSKLSRLESGIVSYLESWPSVCLDYLTRTLGYVRDGLQHLIYASLLNAALQISGATPEQEEDIKRFCKSCSLSSLLEQLQTSDMLLTTGSCDSVDMWEVQPVIVSLTFHKDDTVTFNNIDTCQFCKNAADKLVTFDPKDVTRIKEFVESIKLAFIHNLNKLKRFLKQAELDHYALYSALSYLKKCGCGSLILRYVKLDAGPETKCVLTALENFISNTEQSLA